MRFFRAWPLPAVTLLIAIAVPIGRARRVIVPGSHN